MQKTSSNRELPLQNTLGLNYYMFRCILVCGTSPRHWNLCPFLRPYRTQGFNPPLIRICLRSLLFQTLHQSSPPQPRTQTDSSSVTYYLHSVKNTGTRCKKLVNLLQSPARRLRVEEIDGRHACRVDHRVDDEVFVSDICESDRCDFRNQEIEQPARSRADAAHRCP